MGVYSWPKIWGAEAITLFIRSLRALHRLQEKYNHLLHKAIVGLYDRLVDHPERVGVIDVI